MNKITATYADYLGKQQDFIDAIQSDLGKELVKDWILEADRLLMKIIDESADENDRADFRSIKRMIDKIVARINEFNEVHEKYKKEIGEQNERRNQRQPRS